MAYRKTYSLGQTFRMPPIISDEEIEMLELIHTNINDKWRGRHAPPPYDAVDLIPWAKYLVKYIKPIIKTCQGELVPMEPGEFMVRWYGPEVAAAAETLLRNVMLDQPLVQFSSRVGG